MSKTCEKCVYFCKSEDKCGLIWLGIKYSDSNACEQFKGRNRMKDFLMRYSFEIFMGVIGTLVITIILYVVYLEIKNPTKPYRIIEVDGCEYIKFMHDERIMHKANCKNHGKDEK